MILYVRRTRKKTRVPDGIWTHDLRDLLTWPADARAFSLPGNEIAFCSFPCSVLRFFSYHITQAPYALFFFYLVSMQVSSHLPFAYLSLTSLSSTPPYYEIQLRIVPRQIIFILLDSVKCIKFSVQFTYSFVWCMFHSARKHALNVFIVSSLVNKGGWLNYFCQ